MFLKSFDREKERRFSCPKTERRQCCRKFKRTMRCRQRCKNALSASVREGEIKGMGLSILRNLLIIMTMFLSQKNTSCISLQSVFALACIVTCRITVYEPTGLVVQSVVSCYFSAVFFRYIKCIYAFFE